MKIELIHGLAEINQVLGVEEKRLAEIMRNGQTTMIKSKHAKHGSKARFLEFIIEQCNTLNEVIAATIFWKDVTDHMQRVQGTKEQYQKDHGIIAPKGIVKPLT